MKRFDEQHYIGNSLIKATKKTFNGKCVPHFHDFCEIEYVIDGSGSYVIDDKTYTIKKGALFFSTPLNFHYVHDSSFQLYNVMFSSSVIDNEILSKIIPVNTFFIDENNEKFLTDLFEELLLSGAVKYSSILLNAILYKLSTLSNVNSHFSQINNAVIYLFNNFRNNVTLSEVAEHTGYSVNYFSYLFKKEMGLSFKNFIDDLRFEYARKLLTHTDYSVCEVCKLSGFDDYANFVRRFKKRFNVTATQLKNESKNS